MDKNGMFGEILEQGQQVVQNTVKSAVSDVAGAVTGQVGVKNETNNGQQAQNQVKNQTQTPAESSMLQAASTPETMDLVKEFYAPSEGVMPVSPSDKQQEQQVTQQKLEKLRQELHSGEYYQPLIAYETKKPGEEEEGAAERVEKQEKEEEQKKMELEEKKAKEDQDIATSRAQRAVESNRGAAG